MGSMISCCRKTLEEDARIVRIIVRDVLQEIEEQQQQQQVSRTRSQAKSLHGSQHAMTPKSSKSILDIYHI